MQIKDNIDALMTIKPEHVIFHLKRVAGINPNDTNAHFDIDKDTLDNIKENSNLMFGWILKHLNLNSKITIDDKIDGYLDNLIQYTISKTFKPQLNINDFINTIISETTMNIQLGDNQKIKPLTATLSEALSNWHTDGNPNTLEKVKNAYKALMKESFEIKNQEIDTRSKEIPEIKKIVQDQIIEAYNLCVENNEMNPVSFEDKFYEKLNLFVKNGEVIEKDPVHSDDIQYIFKTLSLCYEKKKIPDNEKSHEQNVENAIIKAYRLNSKNADGFQKQLYETLKENGLNISTQAQEANKQNVTNIFDTINTINNKDPDNFTRVDLKGSHEKFLEEIQKLKLDDNSHRFEKIRQNPTLKEKLHNFLRSIANKVRTTIRYKRKETRADKRDNLHNQIKSNDGVVDKMARSHVKQLNEQRHQQNHVLAV
jgi:hypothetical protein